MVYKKLKFLLINDKKRINQEFVRKDLELFSKVVEITKLKNIPDLSNFIRNILRLPYLIKIARKYDYIYGWWLYNYLATIVGFFAKKPVILVSGGNDTAYMPEIKYGAFCNPILNLLVRINLKLVYYIRFVDKHLKFQLETNGKTKVKRYSILPTFFDSEFWVPNSKERKYILSVSGNSFSNKQKFFTRFLVKGIDRFLKLARMFPNEIFLLVGYKIDIFRKYIKNIPPNLNVIEKVSKEDLLKLYQKTKIYCQFSRHEGFPNAICEAMLCGCMAISSKEKGILTATNNFGTIIDFKEKNAWFNLSKEFMRLLNSKEPINIKGRNYIIRNYDNQIGLVKSKKFIEKLIKSN
ncbi:MAG: glycosyltransferase [Candidatus Lokiarchaeota archaeon]